MKKKGNRLWPLMTVFVAVVLSCSTAQATLIIYSQDFSSNPLVNQNSGNHFLPSSSGVSNTTADYEDWVHTKATYNGTGDFISISTAGNSGKNDASRGTGFALDGDKVGAELQAGDYSLSFNVIADNPDGIGVGIYAMDFGGTSRYKIDTVSGPGGWVFAEGLDASNTLTTLSPDQMITGTGTKTINFTVGDANAGDDLIFLFTTRTTVAEMPRSTSFDDVVVSFTAVPEPSSFTFMGLGLAGFCWLLRRRKLKAIEAIQEG
ncbi:MAG: PEP-CTERM sorting domain-containing protein [Verrucomicrobiales bacterium]|nr:PEP-CTERM sorting domain-containing protein [Verrucomicrobiales bacterium]